MFKNCIIPKFQRHTFSECTNFDRENGIEKPSVNLVEFAKTDLLAKNGGSETVSVTFSLMI